MPPGDLPDRLIIPSYPMPLMDMVRDASLLSPYVEQHLIHWRKGEVRAMYQRPTRNFTLGDFRPYESQLKPKIMSQEWISDEVKSIEDLEVSMFGLSQMMSQAVGTQVDKFAREVMMATTGGYHSNWYTWNDSTSSTSGNFAGADVGNYQGTSTWIWGAWTTNTDFANTQTDNGTVANNFITMRYTWDAWNKLREETSAERAAREAREVIQNEEVLQAAAESRERLRIQKEEAAEASAKATALLREILDDKQIKDFDANKTFIVVAASKKLYKIRAGGSPLEVSPDGKTLASFCIHPTSRNPGLPKEDVMLAHKLMLEDDEANWLEIANRSPR